MEKLSVITPEVIEKPNPMLEKWASLGTEAKLWISVTAITLASICVPAAIRFVANSTEKVIDAIKALP